MTTTSSKPEDSGIHISNGGTTFYGSDATQLYRATVIASAIRLYLRTGMKANRAYTPTNMLRAAESITKKHYKRGRKGLTQAAADIDTWAATMRAALPITDGRTKKVPQFVTAPKAAPPTPKPEEQVCAGCWSHRIPCEDCGKPVCLCNISYHSDEECDGPKP